MFFIYMLHAAELHQAIGLVCSQSGCYVSEFIHTAEIDMTNRDRPCDSIVF